MTAVPCAVREKTSTDRRVLAGLDAERAVLYKMLSDHLEERAGGWSDIGVWLREEIRDLV